MRSASHNLPLENRLVVRYGATFDGIDIISIHKEVLEQYGKVLFAKIGKPLGQGRIDEINRRTASKLPNNAYLVSSGGKQRRVYEITIDSAARGWRSSFQEIQPPFYKTKGMQRIAKTWLVLTSIKERPPFAKHEFRTMAGGDLSESLDTSTAGVFIVEPYR
jgi:hypothetical protein